MLEQTNRESQLEYEEASQGDFSVTYPHRGIIFDVQTRFQRVTLVDTLAFGRALFLDRILNSAESDEFMYHEGIVHPAMVRAEKRERILVIGGAEGGSIREVLRYPDVREVVMVDIDEELVELCRQHLADIYGDPFSDPRVQLHFSDGRKYVEQSNNFDVIIIDLNEANEGGPAQLLFTVEFYEAVRTALAPGGVVSVQSEWITSEFHRRLTATQRAAFPAVRTQEVSIPSFLIGEAFNLLALDGARLQMQPGEIARILMGIRGPLRYYDEAMDTRIGTLPAVVKQAYQAGQGGPAWEVFSDAALPVYEFKS